MLTSAPATPNPSKREVRIAAVAEFLATKQLSDVERGIVDKCIANPYSKNDDTMFKLAEPYYRGYLVQLLEVLERMPLDSQGCREIRRARDVGIGPSGSPKMHCDFLTATCRRHGIALPAFASKRIERPTKQTK